MQDKRKAKGEGTMRVLVCGSRTFGATDEQEDQIRARLEGLAPGTIVMTGGARGADYFASKIALELGLPVETFLADWGKHGKRAGIIRNLEMLDTNPDLVLAFWDGSSRGTRHTLDEADRRGIQKVIYYDPPKQLS